MSELFKPGETIPNSVPDLINAGWSMLGVPERVHQIREWMGLPVKPVVIRDFRHDTTTTIFRPTRAAIKEAIRINAAIRATRA